MPLTLPLLYPIAVVLKLSVYKNYQRMLKQIAGPHPQSFGFSKSGEKAETMIKVSSQGMLMRLGLKPHFEDTTLGNKTHKVFLQHVIQVLSALSHQKYFRNTCSLDTELN